MKFIALDLDDTLYKEVDFVKSAFRAVAAEFSCEFDVYSLLWNSYRNGENQFDKLIEKEPDIKLGKLLQIYRYHEPIIKLDSETHQVIEIFHEKSILGIITDGREVSQWNKIKSLKLDRYVKEDNILISEVTGHDKTEENNFRFFMDEYPNVNQFYYIGDNPIKDFYYPNKLGWTTIQLNNNGCNIHSQNVEVAEEYKAKYNIDNLMDSLDIIYPE